MLRRFSLQRRGIGTQIALLVVLSVLLAHAMLTLFFALERRWSDAPAARTDPAIAIGALARLIDKAPPDRRPELLDAGRAAWPALDIQLVSATATMRQTAETPTPARGDMRMRRIGEMSGGLRVSSEPASSGQSMRLSIVLSDGSALLARVDAATSAPPFLGGPFGLTLIFLGAALALLVAWAARVLIRPLADLTNAASRYDPERADQPFPQAGPAEIRALGGAFNAMRDRIGAMVAQRTQMLATIGHDLRTPITRLRLRAEDISDGETRDSMVRDLSHMNALVNGALSFLRDGANLEPFVALDLASLIKTVCDDHGDVSSNVVYVGPDHLTIEGAPESLQRALSNLIDNAVKFAGGCEVALSVEGDQAVIDVFDEGPGVPEGAQRRLLLPFERGDAPGALGATPGFGLGLAIARGVAERHAGDLTLTNRPGRGLRARLSLPLNRAAR